MAPELALPFSVVSVVEDVLQTHGSCLSDIHLASRMAEEACTYPLSLSLSLPFLISFFQAMFTFNPLTTLVFCLE